MDAQTIVLVMATTLAVVQVYFWLALREVARSGAAQINRAIEVHAQLLAMTKSAPLSTEQVDAVDKWLADKATAHVRDESLEDCE